MQRKLTAAELSRCYAAMLDIRGLPWDGMTGGRDRWRQNAIVLEAMHHHGTSDGKPWVEPERPIEKGEWVVCSDTPGVFGSFAKRYRGDMGDDPGGYRYGIIGSMSLWKHVRRATPAEIARAEAAE